jgi:micrococcal nuclease
MTAASRGGASPVRDPVRRAATVVVALVALSCGLGPSGDPADDRTTASVIETVDGDTIRVDLGGMATSVRLIGIDTPETDGPFTDEECFGIEAGRFTDAALAGREVELEYDVERLDRFGRTLAYVWVDGTLFNERIVREGYAMVATFPPNVRYVDRLTAAQRLAREGSLGLWRSCPAQERP